jgi:hypothetical protein
MFMIYCHRHALLIGTIISILLLLINLSNRGLSANDANDRLIIQYCSEHESDIINGSNPVNDLVNNGTVEHSYQDKTCNEVRHTYQEAKSTNLIENKLKSNKQLR